VQRKVFLKASAVTPSLFFEKSPFSFFNLSAEYILFIIFAIIDDEILLCYLCCLLQIKTYEFGFWTCSDLTPILFNFRPFASTIADNIKMNLFSQ